MLTRATGALTATAWNHKSSDEDRNGTAHWFFEAVNNECSPPRRRAKGECAAKNRPNSVQQVAPGRSDPLLLQALLCRQHTVFVAIEAGEVGQTRLF